MKHLLMTLLAWLVPIVIFTGFAVYAIFFASPHGPWSDLPAVLIISLGCCLFLWGCDFLVNGNWS